MCGKPIDLLMEYYTLSGLWFQVYETTIQHEQVTTSLKDRLAVLEAEAKQHAGVVAALNSQHKEKLDKLQEEKAMIEVIIFLPFFIVLFQKAYVLCMISRHLSILV